MKELDELIVGYKRVGRRIVRGPNYAGTGGTIHKKPVETRDVAGDDTEDDEVPSVPSAREKVKRKEKRAERMRAGKSGPVRKITLDVAEALKCAAKPRTANSDGKLFEEFEIGIRHVGLIGTRKISFTVVSSRTMRHGTATVTYMRLARGTREWELPEHAFRRRFESAIVAQHPKPKTMVYK
ncbi:MAG TPA: hypothetical protein VFS75_00850 [Candidatus Paceibacterota bacterium]|nr:hypothetical protein [Candidatus Paceibacterota bacterium]